MSWRTVVISKRCKLDLKMGYMVVRGEEVRRIFLDEIAILMIENPAVSMTGCLLEALTEKKVRVIFCGTDRTPMTELVPLHGSHDTTRKLRQQLAWDENIKGSVWSGIVKDKIRQQAGFLQSGKSSGKPCCWSRIFRRLSFRTAQTERDTPQKYISTRCSEWTFPDGMNIQSMRH